MDLIERTRVEEALSESEAKYHSLFDAIDEGFCIIEVLFEEETPVDYRFLEVNPSFERHTGLTHTEGKRMREFIPQHEQDWFDIYGQVAISGQSHRFQRHAEQLGRWYDVFAFRVGKPADHQVAVLFNDITGHKQAEQAVQASEQRLRSIIDQLPAGVGVMDKAGVWVLTNDHMAAFLPHPSPLTPPDDRAGEALWDAQNNPISPEQWPGSRALRGEVVPGVELRHIADGRTLWTRVSAAPLRDDPGGEIFGATVIVQDITQEKDAEEVRRRQAETFATLVEQSPLGIYTVDSQFRIRNVSAGAMPAFRSVQPLIGRDFAEVMRTLWPEPFASEAIHIFRQTLETGVPYLSTGLTEKRKDIGAIESYEWQTIRVTLADGQYGVVCYYFDTTRLQQAIQAIRESEERFRALTNATNDIVYCMNPDWTEMRYLAGRRFIADTLRPSHSWLETYIPPDDQQRVMTIIQQAIESKSKFELEHRVIQMNGRVGWTLSRAIPILDQQGEILEWFGAASDVTERKMTHARLEEFADELERQVTHRTLELLQSQERLRALGNELNLAEQRERQRLAMELHDHLQQLLILGKLTIGQGKRTTVDQNAAEVMTKVDGLLSDALNYTRNLVTELSPPVLRDHGLAAGLKWLGEYMKKHDLWVAVSVPAGEMRALPHDLEVLVFQSVRELLINCSKHAKTRQATVILEQHADSLQIAVRDEGLGFDLTADPVDGELSSKFGLFSIRERMRTLGGSLDLHSMPNQGTTATLILPLLNPKDHSRKNTGPSSDKAAMSREQAVRKETPPAAEPNSPASASNIGVLLVDDHAMVRQGLKAVLDTYSDITVVGEATNGVQAVMLAERLQPTLVVMDINMPKMNGIEATARITASHPHPFVIGLSVNTGEENSTAMINAGAVRVLNKEAAVDELYQTIREVLSAYKAVVL